MYEHDAARYPAYFGKSDLPVIEPTIQKAGGTTARIVSGMSEWASRIPDIDPRYRITTSQLRSPVLKAISERADRAVTFSLFKPYLGELEDSPIAGSQIRRTISRLFATDYRNFGDNDVPTGMRGLGFFEGELAKDFPFYDVPILAELVRLSGIRIGDATSREKMSWESLLLSRDSDAHALFAATLRWIIAALADFIMIQRLIDRQDEVRQRGRELLRRLTLPQNIAARSISGEDLYSLAASNASILARQLGADHRLAEALERLHDDFLPPPRTDVLLVVATEIENEAVIEIFGENGYELIDRYFSSINAYQRFSPVSGARIALVRCSMGLGGPGGPELTVAEAIKALAPTSVIMVGIAFGVDAKKQRIGDVLLSTHIADYELERVGTDAKGRMVRISRGAVPDASPRLLARFRMARLQNFELRIREGVILSGKKLVDNLDYRDSLRASFPEAIGGEMEGHGIYSAASRSRVDWIIVKAICDWADGTKRSRKSSRQRLAARNAALAVLRTLELDGFAS